MLMCIAKLQNIKKKYTTDFVGRHLASKNNESGVEVVVEVNFFFLATVVTFFWRDSLSVRRYVDG